MLKTYSALSIVAPSGTKIAQGLKTLEIRSWTPKQLPLRDLVIVENTQFLTAEYTEEMGERSCYRRYRVSTPVARR